MGTSISDILSANGIVADEESLSHYGTKGMRWGKRKDKINVNSERKSENKRRAEARAKTKSMTDDELKTAIARLKLEKEYKELNAHQISAGQKMVGKILTDVGTQAAKGALSSAISSATTPKTEDQIKAALLKKALKAAPKPAPGPMKLKLVGQT